VISRVIALKRGQAVFKSWYTYVYTSQYSYNRLHTIRFLWMGHSHTHAHTHTYKDTNSVIYYLPYTWLPNCQGIYTIFHYKLHTTYVNLFWWPAKWSWQQKEKQTGMS